MAISVDPLTDIIYVPKADLTLVQASPEVREIDLNWFHLKLLDWEDSEDAIPRPKTHSHNTEVSLAGLTYARIIEILLPYTVEFEDGQYTVNCVGANHNISDRKVANQVSLIVNNAAGLIGNAQIEYASFNGGITVDMNNVSGKATSGTAFPAGTPQQPVDNWVDALLIDTYRGFDHFYIEGDTTISGALDLTDKEIHGQSPNRTTMTIEALASTSGAVFRNATVTGTLDGENHIADCVVNDLIYVNGKVLNCGLIGDITLAGNKDATFNDCYTVDQDDPPVIDMGGTGQSLAMPNYSGLLTIENLSDANAEIGIGVNHGAVVLESTVTAGTIIVAGVGTIFDNSTGTAYVNTDALISKDLISQAVWDEPIANHLISGSTGLSVGIQQFSGGVHIDTASGNSGTTFPTGTEGVPVDNLADALSIGATYGLNTLILDSDITVGAGENISGQVVKSDTRREVTLTAGCFTFYTAFESCGVNGDPNGYVIFDGCSIGNINNFYGTMVSCTISGDIQLSSDNTKNAIMYDVWIGNVTTPPTVDLNGDGAKLSLRGLTGALWFTNKTGTTQKSFIDIYSGRIGFDSSVTAGEFFIRGAGYIYTNNSTGATFDTTGLMSKNTVAEAAWDSLSHHVHYDASTSNTGTDYPMGTAEYPVNNIADVVSICEAHGKHGIVFAGQMLITQDLIGYSVTGSTSVLVDVAVVAGVDVSNTVFDLCTVTGTAGGSSNIQALNGIVADFNGFDGVIINGGCSGTVQAKTGGQIIGKSIAFAGASDVIDANGAAFIGLDFNGVFTLQNLTGGGFFQAGGSFGEVTLDASCNGGIGRVYGTITVTDNATQITWLAEKNIDQDTIADGVWSSTSGMQVLTDLTFVAGIEGGKWEIVNGQMIFYLDDNTTEIARFDLTYDGNLNPIQRTRI